MVGGGSETAALEEHRRHLGLLPIVMMTGDAIQDDVVRWWQRASIGVLTSEQEGLPVSLMEAAACGVPVVAPAVGGVPEVVEDGVTGILVAPGDATACADGLQRLVADSSLRRAMGTAARRRAEERFSLRLQVDRLLALWADVLSR
jgi:glycosyltransferase involved in cell wall biosynthesis